MNIVISTNGTDITYNNVTQAKNGTYYGQIKGIVAGNQIITLNMFTTWCNQLSMTGDLRARAMELRQVIDTLPEITYIDILKHQMNNITDLMADDEERLQRILNEASFLLTGREGMMYGGVISLLSTFESSDGEETRRDTYEVTDQEQINARKNLLNGLYRNSARVLSKVQGMSKYGNIFQMHFNSLIETLETPVTETEDRQTIQIWLYYHYMIERNNEEMFLQRRRRTNVGVRGGQTRGTPLANIIYGGQGMASQGKGYAQEAFYTHWKLFQHDETMVGPLPGVVNEYGGITYEFLNLLSSGQGNVTGSKSGDIVIADQNNRIYVNTQSKYTTSWFYDYQTKRRQFLTNMNEFLGEILNNGVLTEARINALYNKFSAEIWVPIERKYNDIIQKQLNREIRDAASHLGHR